MNTPTDKVLSALERCGHKARPSRQGSRQGWVARCPAHDDKNPSLSIGEGGDGRVLVRCHAGCTPEKVCAALGLTLADLMPEPQGTHTTKQRQKPRPVKSPSGNGKPGPHDNGKPAGKTFATDNDAIAELERQHGERTGLWTYHDAQGEPVGLVVRWDGPDGKDIRPVARYADGWHISAMPAPRPLYGLHELRTAPVVVVTEGEKAADAARKCGLVATTSAGGAMAASKTDWSPLAGRSVIILPDNDEPGLAYAAEAARILTRLNPPATVRILNLADYASKLPAAGDLADVLASPDWCGLPIAEGAEPADLGSWIRAKADGITPWTPEPGDEPLAWQPYPTAALPEPFGEFVTSTAEALGCDASYVALPLLVAAAAAIGTTRRLAAKTTWKVPSILWGTIVGESGTLKTPALSIALQWTRKHQENWLADYREAQKQFKSDWQVYEKEFGQWKRSKNGELPPAAPEAPEATRVLVEDTTVEALAPILQANPRGVLLARDELAGWLGGFDRYANTKGADAAHWLSMYNAESLLVDRKTSGTFHVPLAAVSIVGGIQPGILRRALGAENRENGLAARLLLTMPPRHAKRWTEADIVPAVASAVGDVFGRLFALEYDVNQDGKPVARLMRLDADAKKAYVEFYNRHAKALAAAEGDWAAALSKLEEIPLRLALVLHLVRWAAGQPVDPDVVDVDSMARAIQITEWHKHETARVYEILDADEEDEGQRQLIEWITRHGGAASVRDLAHHGPRRFRSDSAAAEVALDSLVEGGFGRWEDAPKNQKGGRPTRVFRLVCK